ncbi:MAG: hypothetical protein JW784_03855 [Candidatus Cloacimonetes bacterium]|nr:hypothetical protein [Candidatus Cloacimonadota bacterium]
MNTLRNGRGGYILFLLILLFFIIILVRQNSQPRQISGMVEYKMITGMRDELLQVIMLQTPSEFIHKDPVFDTLISTRSLPDIISDSLFSNFEDIKYRVSIFNNTRNETSMYFLNREMFEMIDIGNIYQFEIDPKHRDTIRKTSLYN